MHRMMDMKVPAEVWSLPRSQTPPRGRGPWTPLDLRPSPNTHQHLPPWLAASDHGDGAGDGLGGGGTVGTPGHGRRESCQTQVHAFRAALGRAGGAAEGPGAFHGGQVGPEQGRRDARRCPPRNQMRTHNVWPGHRGPGRLSLPATQLPRSLPRPPPSSLGGHLLIRSRSE